jgi:polysaccharide export outer membrane protein
VILVLAVGFCIALFSRTLSAQNVAALGEGSRAAADSAKGADVKSADVKSADPIYLIQPNDVLEIYVWKEAALSRKVLVRPDGRISFPLIQDLMVAGMTPEAVKQDIEKGLKQYYDVPNVTVIVDAIQSYKVFVVGKVGRPGQITSEKPLTILQVLALVGGFQDFAKTDDLQIFRNVGATTDVFHFNYSELTKGRNFNQNMLLKSGDTIVIP